MIRSTCYFLLFMLASASISSAADDEQKPSRFVHVPQADEPMVPFGMLRWEPERIFHLDGAGCGRPDLLKVGASVFPELKKFQDAATERTPFEVNAGLGRWRQGGWNNPPAIATHVVSTRSGLAEWAFNDQHIDEDGRVYLFIWGEQVPQDDAKRPEDAPPILRLPQPGERIIAGTSLQSNFCGHGQEAAYLHWHLTFDQPVAAIDKLPGSNDRKQGVRLTFATKDIKPTGYDYSEGMDKVRLVKGRLGISWVSVENAKLNVDTEISDWKLEPVQATAATRWRKFLDRLDLSQVSDANLAAVARLHLARTLHHPNVFSDVNGQFMGFDTEVHEVRDPRHTVYHIFSAWDTYRTHMPLVSLLWPEVAADIAQTFVYQTETGGGGFARWSIAHRETGTMEGDPSTTMIATADAFGVRGFDREKAFDAMVRNATTPGLVSSPGYAARPNLEHYLQHGHVGGKYEGKGKATGFSGTLEYGRSDFALSRMAQRMGREDLAERFLRQANNFKSMADEKHRLLNHPGSASKGRVESRGDEGNNFAYQYYAYYNLPWLFELHGGSKIAEVKLDAHWREFDRIPAELRSYNSTDEYPPHVAMWIEGAAGAEDKLDTRAHPWNEMSYFTPLAYNWLGKPYKTQVVARSITNVALRWNDEKQRYDAGRIGQTDLGAFQSWALWLSLGLYPAPLGEAGFTISSPRFSRVSFPLGGTGRHVTIIAHDAAASHPYIQKMTVNGKAWDRPWLPFDALGEDQNIVEFWMSDRPNMTWGISQPPPSYDAEPLYLDSTASD